MVFLQTSAMAATVCGPSPHLVGGARQTDQPVDTEGHCRGPGTPAVWSDLVSLVMNHRSDLVSLVMSHRSNLVSLVMSYRYKEV